MSTYQWPVPPHLKQVSADPGPLFSLPNPFCEDLGTKYKMGLERVKDQYLSGQSKVKCKQKESIQSSSLQNSYTSSIDSCNAPLLLKKCSSSKF